MAGKRLVQRIRCGERGRDPKPEGEEKSNKAHPVAQDPRAESTILVNNKIQI